MSYERDKVTVEGRFVKLLHHTRTERGMRLEDYETRCLLRHEIHEIVTTDQRDAVGGERIDRVGFLGFAEVERGGVVERGDPVRVDGREIGQVVGFDECHFPNHLNVLIASEELLTADALTLRPGARIAFGP